MKFHPGRLLCAFLSLCLLWLSLPAAAEKTDLKALQSRLLSLGYEIGTADGILGDKTTAAIRLAQAILADHGFSVSPTGTPDAKTAELILEEENGDLLRTLQKGSWGSRVREAQQKLVHLNLLNDSADGSYGESTIRRADGRSGAGPDHSGREAVRRRIFPADERSQRLRL